MSVSLEPGENPKAVYRDVYRSLMGVCQQEAAEALAETLRISQMVEGI